MRGRLDSGRVECGEAQTLLGASTCNWRARRFGVRERRLPSLTHMELCGSRGVRRAGRFWCQEDYDDSTTAAGRVGGARAKRSPLSLVGRRQVPMTNQVDVCRLHLTVRQLDQQLTGVYVPIQYIHACITNITLHRYLHLSNIATPRQRYAAGQASAGISTHTSRLQHVTYRAPLIPRLDN